MVTMKDVAKLAGVSHGTVSNVINGGKQVSVDKIKRVEAAMEQLGYRPNTAARNLKMDYTNQMDLIVPNMITGEFLVLYETVRRCAINDGYTLNLKVTDGIADRESMMLNDSLMNNVDGVILVTCQSENTELFEKLTKQGLRIVFCVAEPENRKCNFLGFNVEDVMHDLLLELLEDKKKAALIAGDADDTYHNQLVQSYCSTVSRKTGLRDSAYIKIVRVSPEFAAKGAAKIFSLKDKPDVIIASNETIAKEIRGMAATLHYRADAIPELVVFGQETREAQDDNERVILLPFTMLGKRAYQVLYERIRGKHKKSFVREYIEPVYNRNKRLPEKEWNGKRSLRVLLNESPSSDAVRFLLGNFERISGIRVMVDTLDISQMYHAVKEDMQEQKYDIYSIDVPWVGEFARNGAIGCLDEFHRRNRDRLERLGANVLERFSMYQDHMYGVPYSFSTQLLFYRKDLFETAKNQRLYYEWYKEELKVPQTWEEFNRVAKFFTRAYNPESETEYGTTLGAKDSSGACCEYLPRLWAIGGRVFDNFGCLQDKEPMIAALANYQEAFRYANPKAVDWWWDEQVTAFVNEKAAMMVMFTEHAAVLSEKNHSSIAGKYQTTTLPGNVSVRGGWSLAIRNGTPMEKEAECFLEWICAPQLMELNAILGRVYPVMSPAGKECLEKIYSWYPQAVEGFQNSLPRHIPEQLHERRIMEMDVERMLGHYVHDAIKNNSDPTETVEEQIREMKTEMARLL